MKKVSTAATKQSRNISHQLTKTWKALPSKDPVVARFVGRTP
jgi:hypothetical protein